MRVMREYRPEVREYLRRKMREAADLWNRGHSAGEIEAILDISDRLCRDLLCRAVSRSLITRTKKVAEV